LGIWSVFVKERHSHWRRGVGRRQLGIVHPKAQAGRAAAAEACIIAIDVSEKMDPLLMPAGSDPPQLSIDDFTRRFALRASNLMWFLGAGASASAGIPTAQDMVWEFKQLLFVSQRRVEFQTVADLSNPTIRAQLQAHIDGAKQFPPAGSADEYAALFEAVYPAEADRRAYLDAKLSGAKPSYGHLSLAVLMRAERARLVWTTNFDPLVADACARIFGTTGTLTTAALDAPELAQQAIASGRWPLEVKLHGDFRSRRLKNTTDELRQQDALLRQMMVDACGRSGLAVVGYSGRDNSIMDALEESLSLPSAFPAGLFWLHRGEGSPPPRVVDLLVRAVERKTEAALVRIENFDEALRDAIRMIEGIDKAGLDSFAAERRRWSPAPRPVGRGGWPVVRLNALPVVQVPTVCRRTICQVGGYAEVRSAIEQAGVDVLATRSKAGVLAFGADGDVRKAFEPYSITDFDLHTIEFKRLRYESAERGLLRQALTRAIVSTCGVDGFHRRSADLVAPNDPEAGAWAELRRLVGSLAGVVQDHPELHWREGVSIRLDWADDRLWLLIDPCTVFEGITQANKAFASDFARERTVRRYNRQLNDLIAFWAGCLAQGDELRALGIGDGVDAVFRLSSDTAFSRRA
jgi:NAD-dependent SIR2 family protein deacetylase